MKSILKLAPLLVALASPAVQAVDFGVMESADPVERGHMKFDAYPLVTERVQTQEVNKGVNMGVGYGFGEAWDAEAQVATYDDISFYGADIEYSFFHDGQIELSLGGGLHYGDSDFGEQTGVDVTPLVSYKPATLPGFKWNGALDFAWDDLDRTSDNPDVEDHYFSAYIVPGAQYRIARGVDLIGEIGVGLNSSSNEYASAGLSFYFND